MVYKRSDFTGFQFNIGRKTIEFVFLRHFPITLAVYNRNNTGKTIYLLDIGNLFYKKEASNA